MRLTIACLAAGMEQQRKPNDAQGSRQWYLSVVCMFQNEAAYLDEWLAFCSSEGVEHVLLYDNASTDNSLDVLRPWIETGFVELVDWPIPFESGAQLKAYNHALERLRGRTRWATFIDVDEYLFSPTCQSLREVLERFEGHPGVVVNWQCYGSSGHSAAPPGLTIESYTLRAKAGWARNRRVKTIVDPSRAIEAQSVHLFRVEEGASLVTEKLRPIRVVRGARGRMMLRHAAASLPYLPFDPYALTESSVREVSVETLRINHYVTRSKAETALKYKDRKAMDKRDRQSYTRYHDRNEVEDSILVAKAEEVRAIIRKVRGGTSS